MYSGMPKSERHKSQFCPNQNAIHITKFRFRLSIMPPRCSKSDLVRTSPNPTLVWIVGAINYFYVIHKTVWASQKKVAFGIPISASWGYTVTKSEQMSPV